MKYIFLLLFLISFSCYADELHCRDATYTGKFSTEFFGVYFRTNDGKVIEMSEAWNAGCYVVMGDTK